ncbi:MAG: ATP-dependent Clp protease adaptor ClpS [Mailhella sp.]|nr:ATP-dependent Clp protease adaptor ClpS [Mailhella sp.]
MIPGTETEGEVLEAVELREPKLYKVFLHNDDFTTMDFVIEILIDIFRKDAEEAAAIMMHVHEKGVGLCGIYPREIAEYRVEQTTTRAREAGFPLLCTMEEE